VGTIADLAGLKPLSPGATPADLTGLPIREINLTAPPGITLSPAGFAGGLYIGPEDTIHFFAITNRAGQKVCLTILFLTALGQLQLLQSEIDLPASMAFPENIFQPGAGYVISCSVEYSAEAVFENWTYAAVTVVSPQSPSGTGHAQLFANYVNFSGARSGAYAAMRGPLEGNGFVTNTQFGDIAVPGDLFLCPGQFAKWKVASVVLELVTDGTGGNRQVSLAAQNVDGNNIFQVDAFATIPPSSDVQMFFGVGLPYFKDTSGRLFAPLPDPLYVQGNMCLFTITKNMGAADAFKLASVQAEEWGFF
jgi:hypothetical protein